MCLPQTMDRSTHARVNNVAFGCLFPLRPSSVVAVCSSPVSVFRQLGTPAQTTYLNHRRHFFFSLLSTAFSFIYRFFSVPTPYIRQFVYFSSFMHTYHSCITAARIPKHSCTHTLEQSIFFSYEREKGRARKKETKRSKVKILLTL